MPSLFSSPKLAFEPVDPLGDGLGDDIAREQSEPEAAAFQHDIDATNLANFWNSVGEDLQSDPTWFDMSEE